MTNKIIDKLERKLCELKELERNPSSSEINCIKEYKHTVVFVGNTKQKELLLEMCHILDIVDINASYISDEASIELFSDCCKKCDLILVALPLKGAK